MTLLRFVHPFFHRRGSMTACLICRIVWNRLLRDPDTVAALEQGEADIRAGRLHRWSDVRRDL